MLPCFCFRTPPFTFYLASLLTHALPCCFWTPLVPSGRRSPLSFWTPPLAVFLPDAAARRLPSRRRIASAHLHTRFWTHLPLDALSLLDASLRCALTIRALSRARSLQYNNLDDDAKRAITAVTRPGLDVQL